jgi:triphosphoribosyl-dephospho-CoA synthase
MLCNFLHNIIKFSTRNNYAGRSCHAMRVRKKTVSNLRELKLRTLSAISDHVSRCLQLAILLEVSAYPKPGNVHRTANFQETRYEHFLASTVALAPHFRNAAIQGVDVMQKKATWSQVGVGKIIKNAVIDVDAWQHGGNTLLGSIILLIPMATAAGLTLAENTSFPIEKFRGNLNSVVQFTTAEDAVTVYDAIALAQPGGMGKSPQLDATDARSKQKILEEGISLFEVFKISSSWDSVSAEWVNNYHVTFDLGYLFFTQLLKDKNNVNVATVHTYLKILSEVPDTLIIRKAGANAAKRVSAQAKRVLEDGGLTTPKGRDSLAQFDRKLRDPAHKLNPGTSADITSAVLAIAILSGYRP